MRMNEEEQLKQLQKIDVEHAKKEQDFQLLNARINKKVFHWKIPAVAISIVFLVFFLLMTAPQKIEQRVMSDETTQLVKVLTMDGNGDPTSKWQFTVNENTDVEFLEKVEELLINLQPVTQPSSEREVERTIKLVYNDEAYERWQEVRFGEQLTLYQVAQKQYYEIPEEQLQNWYTIQGWNVNLETNKYLYFVLFSFANMLVQLLVKKKMKQADLEHGNKKRNLERWQTATNLVMVVVLFASLYFFHPLHLSVVVGIIIVAFFVGVWIENNFGYNNWRKLSLLFDAIFQVIVMYFVFILLV